MGLALRGSLEKLTWDYSAQVKLSCGRDESTRGKRGEQDTAGEDLHLQNKRWGDGRGEDNKGAWSRRKRTREDKGCPPARQHLVRGVGASPELQDLATPRYALFSRLIVAAVPPAAHFPHRQQLVNFHTSKTFFLNFRLQFLLKSKGVFWSSPVYQLFL